MLERDPSGVAFKRAGGWEGTATVSRLLSIFMGGLFIQSLSRGESPWVSGGLKRDWIDLCLCCLCRMLIPHFRASAALSRVQGESSSPSVPNLAPGFGGGPVSL